MYGSILIKLPITLPKLGIFCEQSTFNGICHYVVEVIRWLIFGLTDVYSEICEALTYSHCAMIGVQTNIKVTLNILAFCIRAGKNFTICIDQKIKNYFATFNNNNTLKKMSVSKKTDRHVSFIFKV